jgi:hypothetical protein
MRVFFSEVNQIVQDNIWNCKIIYNLKIMYVKCITWLFWYDAETVGNILWETYGAYTL